MPLDTDNHTASYVLGRIYAVIERHPRRGYNNIDRWLKQAMEQPGTTFPRLLDMYDHHNKAADRLITGLMNRLIAPLPLTLDRIDQSSFCLGWRHQRGVYEAR